MSTDLVATSPPPYDRREAEAAVDAELREFFRRRTAAAAAYGPSFERLWALASESARGGKLVRPLLLLDMFDALGSISGDTCSRKVVIEIAAAVELLHLAFLLHDDVIDGDLTRRGRDNLIGRLLADVRSDASVGSTAPTSTAAICTAPICTAPISTGPGPAAS